MSLFFIRLNKQDEDLLETVAEHSPFIKDFIEEAVIFKNSNGHVNCHHATLLLNLAQPSPVAQGLLKRPEKLVLMLLSWSQGKPFTSQDLLDLSMYFPAMSAFVQNEKTWTKNRIAPKYIRSTLCQLSYMCAKHISVEAPPLSQQRTFHPLSPEKGRIFWWKLCYFCSNNSVLSLDADTGSCLPFSDRHAHLPDYPLSVNFASNWVPSDSPAESKQSSAHSAEPSLSSLHLLSSTSPSSERPASSVPVECGLQTPSFAPSSSLATIAVNDGSDSASVSSSAMGDSGFEDDDPEYVYGGDAKCYPKNKSKNLYPCLMVVVCMHNIQLGCVLSLLFICYYYYYYYYDYYYYY